MAGALTLFHYWSSVCSQKVRFALAEKRLAWESRHVDLFRFENWEPGYLAVNPRGVVPTLVRDDDVVIESNVILEYLDDAYPDVPLRPAAAGARARMRRWLHAVDELAHPSVVEISFNARHRRRWAHLSDAELVEIARRNPDPDLREGWLRRTRQGVSADDESRHYGRLDRLCARMEQCLEAPAPGEPIPGESTPAESRWLAGDTFSLADVALAPYAYRIASLAHPEMLAREHRPRLADWWRRVQLRPAFAEAIAFEDPSSKQPG